LFLGEVSGAESLAIDARGSAEHAGEERFARHFERENSNRLLQLEGHMLGDVEGQGGLAHGGARSHNAEVAAMQSAGELVELGEAGADTFDAFAGIEEGVDA